MSDDAPEERKARHLRVALIAGDPVRRAGLAAIVTDAGHQLAEPSADPDVVLVDGILEYPEGPAVVTLGVGDTGQAGVLPSDAWPAQIDAALRAAAAGLIVRLPASERSGFRAAPGPEGPLLTPREVEVLAAIGDGLSNKETARRLGISQHTVKFHLESLFRKLDAASRADAVHKGLRRGLIEL